ncbi:ABC transporter permease [Virgibacillus halodenitrificans]|uniref:ABC transporter permease n=1 Tax=Virgibacillus halodenitrificans TaxID=1482 RepID=A0ABR7VGQ9_VIRHA|nr:ABC transporter permease [Virgibacillus halodenitrificans]MBD1221139.1 ABC transporter permease [Virgibacillus halodenitrificans]MCG1027226.1 ABC transporter permease [Virgibacillus halodenitrificans]MYL57361.1 ABC transporter permease subunit [Virgibacillus halodenitrificans]
MYIIRRILTMLLTVWVIATLTFIMMKLIPGDPFSTEEGALPEEALANLYAKYGLDDPLPIQYLTYMKNLVTFDLGLSMEGSGRSVNEIIASGIGASATLGLITLVVALVFGITLGILAALYHNSVFDYTAMVIATVGISIPNFILAPLLMKFLAVDLQLFPVANWGTWQHTVLPSLALASGPLAIIARFVRSSMLDVMNQDYMKTADAKGLPTYRIVVLHGIRNAILPVISFIGPLFVSLITGTLVIERIFSIPGIGRYFVDSIFNRDYTVIMGTTIFYSLILVVVLFLIDVSYRFIDPRITLTSKGGS